MRSILLILENSFQHVRQLVLYVGVKVSSRGGKLFSRGLKLPTCEPLETHCDASKVAINYKYDN